jgi:hypothetical protein
MEEVDRHGFVSAFIGGVRPEGDQGRTGKRLVVIGVAVAAVAGLGALVIGAFGSTSGTAATAKVSPSPIAAIASPSVHARGGKAATAAGSGTHGAGTAGSGTYGAGGSGTAQGNSNTTTQQTPSSVSTGTAKASTASHPKAAAQAAKKWSGVAGPGCSTDISHFYTKDADYTQGTAGWLKSSTGGYSGDGCDGSYVSEPMSGKSSSYDARQGVIWRFHFGSTLPTASCAVSVYIPANSDIKYVGGNPTHYYFWGEDYGYGMNNAPTGSFQISQVSNRGFWVTQPAFKVTTGIVTVKMVNTGIDYTSSTKYAHHAAADVRLNCTGA